MADNRGLVLWTLCGAGVFLLYAAYKNQSPQTLLLNHLNGGSTVNPISGAPTVPTITDAQGKTWNTAPGDGGYVTSDPPVPGGSTPGYMLGSNHVARDQNGVYNVVDGNGLIIAVVPAAYQSNPSAYHVPVNV